MSTEADKNHENPPSAQESGGDWAIGAEPEVLSVVNGSVQDGGETAGQNAIAVSQKPVTTANSLETGRISSLDNDGEVNLAGSVEGHATTPTPTGSLPATWVILGGVGLMLLGVTFDLEWLLLIGALITLAFSWGLVWPSIQVFVAEVPPQQRTLLVAIPTSMIGLLALMQATGINRSIGQWGMTLPWDILGSLGDFLGAVGQIFVALLALFVAWRQYVISRDLTIQQNRITQQQTIDAYFQGISDLVLDDEGLLEDWPQERIIAEARTAALIGSIDAPGKAKVIRFLSRSRLLTPLKRDDRLGRPILDGRGGYEEDRDRGARVINLGAMLANTNLSGTDLRWADLSDVNLIRANLQNCDLVRTNFSRTILVDAVLAGSDLMGAKFFYGDWQTASPRSRTEAPNFVTGEYTGAVIEGVDFSGVKRLSEEQRRYCCRWCGEQARTTIPGGCEGIPNCLEK
jgi:uncharacterized protein YjbI with pentapeptide repeats